MQRTGSAALATVCSMLIAVAERSCQSHPLVVPLQQSEGRVAA